MATIDVWTQWIGDMQLEKSLKLLNLYIYMSISRTVFILKQEFRFGSNRLFLLKWLSEKEIAVFIDLILSHGISYINWKA